MNIVVTGATGFVGRQLVPLLREGGASLLLVGRDIAKLASTFPGERCCSYEDLEKEAARFDMLLHLAAINNDAAQGPEQFHSVNVDFTRETLAHARAAGIGRFVFVSSTHALDDRNTTPYAASKRTAVSALESATGIGIHVLYLPSVYGDAWGGKLKLLNSLPGFLSAAVFKVLSAIKPTVHVRRVSGYLLDPQTDWSRGSAIVSDGQENNGFYQFTKRLTDISAAVGIMLGLSWLLGAIFVAIKLHSPGPAIFEQKRVGRHGSPFICYKFRTMKVGTAEQATHETSPEMVTSIGHRLRRSKLDELPQVWNLLRNEMSLVGPRPCLPIQIELIEERERRGILSAKPGISGLAQVKGIDMSDPITLSDCDELYIRLQSLLMDLRIVIDTLRGRGMGDKIGN